MNAQLQNQTKASAKFTPVPSSLLQRKCACGNHTVAGGECEECSKKEQTLQRASLFPRGRGTEGKGAVPPIVHEVVRSPGHPLDPDTRAFFEPRFGYDFSRVRVHTDPRAAESAKAVNALAYTLGDHIAFAPGQFAPALTAGRRLLAHELIHVAQQSESTTGQELPESCPFSDQAEAEADRGAAVIMRGEKLDRDGPAGRLQQMPPSPLVRTDPAVMPPATSAGVWLHPGNVASRSAELVAALGADFRFATVYSPHKTVNGRQPTHGMANVVQLRTGGGPRRLQRAPAPKFVDCEPTRHASRIALAQNAINEARAAVPRATKALSNGWAKMPADAKTIFLRHFDPKGTGTIGEGFVENVLSNFRKVEAEIQGRVVIECEKEDGRMCKRTAKGTVLAYTYFLHVHLCPAFETEGDPTVTILHEIVHNALLALDRPYHDKPDEYGQLTPRGPAATRIPILGPIIRAGARKDTLYAPDAYAYFAKEVS